MTPSWLKGGLLAIALGAMAACAVAPTLPLPPPVVSQVSAPSTKGLVTVEGSATPRAVLFLYNEDTEDGTIGRADEAGIYVLVIAGRSGDTLTLWQEAGSGTGEPRTIVVPDP